ncbi:unnamed protein product [Closterium sp. NIES-53]
MATASSSVSRAWDSILGSDSLDSPPAASPSDSRSPSASAPSAASDAASLLERLCPWTSVEFGYPGSLNYRSLLLDFHGQLVSPWHHVPLHAKNGALHFVCKTPQDCWVKYEAAPDEDYTPIRVHRAPAPAAAAASASGVSSPSPSPSPSHLQLPSHVQQGPPSRDGEASRREDLGLPQQEGVLKERAAVDWTRLWPQHYAENSMFNVGFLPQTYADPEQPAGADAAGGIFGGGGSGGVWEGLVNDGRPIEAIEIGGKRMRTGEVCSVRPLAVFAVAGPARAEMSAEGGAGGGGSAAGSGAGEGEAERDCGAEGRAEGRRTLSWVVVVVSTEDALASVIQEGATGIPSVLLPVLEQIVEWVRFAPCVNHEDDEAEFPLGEEPGGMQAAMVVVAQAHCAWQLLADDCPPPPPWVPADRVLSASALHQIWQSRGYLPPAPPRLASSASASAARAGSPAPFPTSSSAPLGPGPPPSPYTSASASASASRPAPLPPNLSMPSLHLTASSCSSPSASPLHASNPPADSTYALPPVSPSFPSPPPFSASSPSASPPPALPPFGAIPMSDQRVGSSARRNEAWARASIDSLAFSSLSLSIDSSFLSSGFGSGGAGSSSAGHSSNGSIGGNSSCDGDVGGAGAGAGGGARGRAEEGLGRGMFRGGLGGSGGAGGKRCGLPRPASSDNLKRFSSAPAERERGEGKQREWRRAQRARGGAGKRTEGSSLGSQGEGKKQHSRVPAAGTAAAAVEAEGLSDEGRADADADAEGEGEGVGSGEFQFDVVQIPGCGFHLLRHAAGGMGAGELGAPMDGGGGAAIGGSFRGSGRFERKAHKGGGGSSSSSSGSSFSRGGLGSMSVRSSSSGRHGGGGGAGSSSGRKAYWAGDLLKGSIPVRAGFGSARRAPSGYGPRGEAGSGEGGGAAAGGGGEGVSSAHLLSASHRSGAFSSPERSGFSAVAAADWAARSSAVPHDSSSAAAAASASAEDTGIAGGPNVGPVESSRSSSVAVVAAAAAGAGAAAAAATARSGSAPPSRLETFFSLRGSSLQSQSQLQQQQQQQQQSALLLPRGAPSLERLFGHRKGKGSSHSGRGELGGGATEAYADDYEASAAAAGGELFGRGLSLSRAEREARVEREEREETGEDGAGVFNRQLSLDQLYLRRKKRAERRLRGANSSASDAPPLSPPASSALGWVLGGGKFSSSGGSGSGYEGGRRRGEESVGAAQHGSSRDDATLLAFRLSPSLVSSHPGATASESMACSEGSAHETAPAMGGLARSIGSSGGGSSTGLQGRWCDLIEEYGGSGARSSASPTEPARPPLPRPLPPRAPSLTKQGLGGRAGEKGGEGTEREDRGADGEEAVVEGAERGQGDVGDLGLDCSASNSNGASGSSSSSSCVVSREEHERQAEESGVAPSAASPSAAASTAVGASSAEASEVATASAMATAAGMRSPSRVGKRQVSFHSVVKVIEFVQAREGEDSSSGSE